MKKKSLKTLKQKAWELFSKYIRLKYSTYTGFCKCVTCDAVRAIGLMQAGHFIDGRNNALLFEEDGVHPQCVQCNIFLHGNKVEYFMFMQRKYGDEVIDRLRSLRHKTVKYTREDLEEKIKIYERKIEELHDRFSNGVCGKIAEEKDKSSF